MEMTDPVKFTETLKRLVDPALVCYWNPMRGRFVIDRCTHPDSSSGLHKCDLACSKTNVMMVEGPDGKYRELGDDLIGFLHASDTWSKYGRLHAAERMDADISAIEEKDQSKRSELIDENWKNVAKDDKRTARKAFHLIQQHDVHRVH